MGSVTCYHINFKFIRALGLRDDCHLVCYYI